jgi:hypothetical protein
MQTALVQCFKRFLKFLNTDRLIIDEKVLGREGLEWLEELS